MVTSATVESDVTVLAHAGKKADDSLGSLRQSLFATVSATWPAHVTEQSGIGLINGEVTMFLAGRGASLPHFTHKAVLWATVAPSAADLHREIELLRAWIIPSYAWDDPDHPFVAPGEEKGSLSAVLLSVSPAGYFRWRCTHADFANVVRRLARMRSLLARRPEHILDRVPSLLELRQQFRTALVTGDRDAAGAVIAAIDHYQLDSAVNTHLMRVRMRDRFGEYAAIVEDPALDPLLGLRMPPAVRTAVIRSFHAVHVLASEIEGPEAAATAYSERVHPRLGALMTLAVPEDGYEVARSLAYRAWALRDADQAAALLPPADAFVAPMLRALISDLSPVSEPSNDLVAAFRAAIEREDVRAIQALAPALLAGLGSATSTDGIDVVDVVRGTLEKLPNPSVSEELARATVGQVIAPATMPQSWSELLGRLRDADWEAAERFLDLDHTERPGPEKLTPEEIDAAIATLEELLTGPAFGPSARERRVTGAALPAFIEDFVSEPRFPRPGLAPLYLQLLRLWAEHKRGSAYAPDGQLLLVLAGAVLQHSAGAEQDVADTLVDWWQVRPVRTALPFLLEAVDLVINLTVEDGAAQQLWLAGATLAGRHTDGLTQTERALWRCLGLQAGFDASVVDEVLPSPAPSTETELAVDPVRQLALQKIAIVSLHARAAEEARALIAERTDAMVFVVDETVVGPATRSAESADVILFVWAATKHAVFRAFDSARERVVYVQGSGAGSIVLALERWAAKCLEDVV